MVHLGREIPEPARRFSVIAPDRRGYRMLRRFAKNYPDATERLLVTRNIPGRMIFERINARRLTVPERRPPGICRMQKA